MYRGVTRGEPCADLPSTAFVGFLQNHDPIAQGAVIAKPVIGVRPSACQG